MPRFIPFLLILTLPLSALGGVEGVWQCNVTTKTTAKANGRTTKAKDFGSSRQTLFPDGSYTSTSPVTPIVAHGTYRLKSRKVTYYPEFGDLAAIAEYACFQAGGSCFVSAISGKTSATANKSFTTMKGTGVLKMTILVNKTTLVRTVSEATSSCVRQ